MTADQLFALANAAVLPAWAILIGAPRGRWGWVDIIPRLIIPVLLSALYAGLILTYLSSSGGGFSSVAALRQLFAHDHVLVAGWVHYLAFDLMIAVMMAGKMDQMGLSRLSQAPLLGLIFIFGPLGVLLIWMTEWLMRWGAK
jgi:hypothetical protein